jgi:hypothetical protein
MKAKGLLAAKRKAEHRTESCYPKFIATESEYGHHGVSLTRIAPQIAAGVGKLQKPLDEV